MTSVLYGKSAQARIGWIAAAVVSMLISCKSDDDSGPETESGVLAKCDADDGGLLLPGGFCAAVFADSLGAARHMTVTPSGDVFVATLEEGEQAEKGGVVALRDEDGDGRADRQERFGVGGNGIVWHEGFLYVGENGRVVRYRLPDGELLPQGEPEVVVGGLPVDGDHPRKTVGFDHEGRLLVNIGSGTNSCQVDNREVGSPGIDPCPELEYRAGIWRFDPNKPEQTQADGERLVTGLRNGNAFAVHPETGRIVAIPNGRDQLQENWPDLYSIAEAVPLPGEELFVLEEGADYGWPYCYYDPLRRMKVLAPEYGGDGEMQGRCAAVKAPDLTLPAHWSPLGMDFYTGTQFPARYRNGAFVANHGSRFDEDESEPLPGYSVIFIPFDAQGQPEAPFELFAGDFAGRGRPLPGEAAHRPVSVAVAPDGSLYVSDDWGGRLWRVHYPAQSSTQM